MARRRLFYRVLLAAATLAVVSTGDAARAQSVDLRGTGDVGGFPTSPTESPLTTPGRVSPPAINGSPAAADEESPSSQPSQNEQDRGAPNYGKTRKMKPKLYKPNPKTSPPLSPLVPYRGAPGQKRVLNPAPPPKDAIDPTQPGPTVAVLPSPLRQKRIPPDLEPFAPIGIRAGELILKPFVETSAGYETNPNQVAAGVKASPVLRAEGGLDLSSDFSSSSLTGSLRGGYSEFPANSVANRPDLSVLVDGRVDVTRQDTIDTEARFTLATQTPGSPLLAVPNSVFIVNRPLIVSEGATLGGTHQFGRLAIGLKGTFDRTQYGDATQSDGSTFQYSLENYNDYGGVLRATYELSPAIIPFSEVGIDSRVHDSTVDVTGYNRDSVGGTARAGATFDLFGHFTGSASAGYLERHYADPRLVDLRGPTVDAQLIYAASALTTVTLRASTTAAETTLAGSPGAISRSFGIELAHTFFSRFTLTGIATVQPNDYQGVDGHEVYSTLELKGAYSVSRDIQLVATATRQTLKSSFIGQGFQDNIFLLGIRLQR